MHKIVLMLLFFVLAAFADSNRAPSEKDMAKTENAKEKIVPEQLRDVQKKECCSENGGVCGCNADGLSKCCDNKE